MAEGYNLILEKIDNLTGWMDKITGLYDKLKQEITLMNGAINRIENERLPAIEKEVRDTREDLRKEIKDVKDQLKEHMSQPAHI